MSSSRSLRAMSADSLVLYMAALGAMSGLCAWALIWVAGLILDMPQPGLVSLLLAIPRGALFGAVAASIMRGYWRWQWAGHG
jgi:hypothetical protein